MDSDYKFIWADIGGRGAASDAQLWNESDLKDAAENDDLHLPYPEPLPNDTEDVPYFFIGENVFHYIQIEALCIATYLTEK